MKKYIAALGLACLMSSCEFLDYQATTGRTKEEAFSYYENYNSLLATLYSYLPADFGSISNAMLECATDNAMYTWEDNAVYHMIRGVWSPLKTVDNAWNYWTAIRQANLFIENYDPSALDKYKNNEDYDEISGKASAFLYEARFLRAFYYFELAKRYGGIPLLTTTYQVSNISEVPKSSFETIIKFIVDECDDIATNLPEDQKDFWGDTGRATEGAVRALKSRALLYAASPLHNDKSSSDYLAKWEAAAKAANDVIAMDYYYLQRITSDKLYSNRGGNEVLKSKQLIFERRDAEKTNSFELRNEPMGYEGAKGGNVPTQNLVDAFEFLDGTAFDWNNPEHVKNMYVDAAGKPTRDPRLYLNVLHNGSTWLGETVETFVGGKNLVLEGSTPTGYYLRKHMNPSVTVTSVNPNKQEHHYVLMRYAEILLNYAEAMNEWMGPDATTADCVMSATDALNEVRYSAKMPEYSGLDKDTFRAKVRNERRIELAFEGHRFFDLRRWKIASNPEVCNVYGVTIEKQDDGSFQYNRKNLYTIAWDDKMYLYPFPQNEVYKNPNGLSQNIGW